MPQLTISSLIAELTKMQEEGLGDLPVILVDADTGWRFILQAKHLEVNDYTLDISVDYNVDRLEGELDGEEINRSHLM